MQQAIQASLELMTFQPNVTWWNIPASPGYTRSGEHTLTFPTIQYISVHVSA